MAIIFLGYEAEGRLQAEPPPELSERAGKVFQQDCASPAAENNIVGQNKEEWKKKGEIR